MLHVSQLKLFMKKLRIVFCSICSFASLVFGSAYGQGFGEAMSTNATFPEFPDSKHIHGPKITAADLEGKVVFFEYWGIDSEPSRARMPELQDLQKKYGSKGLVVIGSHSREMSPEVKKFLQEQRVTFSVYQGVKIPELTETGELPLMGVIGMNGQIVASGVPSVYTADIVKKEVAKFAAGYPIFENLALDKYRSMKALTSKGSNIEGKIEPLREKNDAEAKKICKEFDNWVASTKKSIDKIIAGAPLEAASVISAFKKAVPSIKDYDEVLQKLKANKSLSKLVSLQKKVAEQEMVTSVKGKVNAKAVTAIQAELGKISAVSNDEITTKVVETLKGRLDALPSLAE